MRCAPDLSAYDAGVYILQDGSDTPAGGTSAAAPIVAGMLASINAALAEKNLPPLGFVNPFLYKNADAFLDVVRGSNGGFNAVEGFDPASVSIYFVMYMIETFVIFIVAICLGTGDFLTYHLLSSPPESYCC